LAFLNKSGKEDISTNELNKTMKMEIKSMGEKKRLRRLYQR
jgi:hypothetical protein